VLRFRKSAELKAVDGEPDEMSDMERNDEPRDENAGRHACGQSPDAHRYPPGAGIDP
jgi:hypothetical protein